jgi:sulfatase maturation enzyme AslB (radical SAM superfamily)
MPARAVARPTELLDPGVRTVELMLTTACNFQCSYCDQRRAAGRTMPPAVLDAAICRLVSSRLQRPRLTLFGGEPLLAAPLVRRALDRVRRCAPRWMKPEVRIMTNGTLLDEGMTRLLASRDVFITISFDGVPPAQEARSPGSFEVLDRLLVRIKREHPTYFRKRVAVKVTLTRENVRFLSESFRYFLSRGIGTVDIAPVSAGNAGWTAAQAQVLDRQLAVVARLSRKEFRRSGEIPFTAFRSATVRVVTPGAPACGCGSRGLVFVDVDGSLAPCSGLVPSTLGPTPAALRRVAVALGGLRVTDVDLPSALRRREDHARRLRFLRKPADRPTTKRKCARCAARATCLVCPVSIALARGRVPAFPCDVNRLVERHRAAFQRWLGREKKRDLQATQLGKYSGRNAIPDKR